MLEERDFCYGEDVRIRKTTGTVNQGLAGRHGSVVCTFGDLKTEGVVVYVGNESVALPAHSVEHC